MSPEPGGLDDLAGGGTAVVDAGDLTVLPAFADSHEHLMEASRNTLLVPVDMARSIAEFTALVRDAARDAPPGKWILTSIGWNESNLAENRMPTGAELDAAAPDHPVFARRAGIWPWPARPRCGRPGSARHTRPQGGTIGRVPDGSPSGLLEGGAVYQVAAFAPATPPAELAGALGTASAAYAALGVGTIREAMINLDELLAYQDAWRRGRLNVRARPMIRVGAELTADEAVALIDGLGVASGFGDDWLRIWGLKFVLDGGVEGAALEQPYANDPANSGHLNWDPAAMTRVCAEAVRRGLKVGTHAAGDRAVRILLDVYEGVVAATGELPPWTLVIEHALLSRPGPARPRCPGRFRDHRAARAAVEHGPRDAGHLGSRAHPAGQPADEWLALGAGLAAGTDIVRPLNPMTSVWGMVTRGTKSAGVQGPEHAIDVATALRLYTLGTAELNGDADRLGSVAPGKLADLVAYPADPLNGLPG